VAVTAALRWAWGTFHSFSLLVTAPDHYDRHVPVSPYLTQLADAPAHALAVAQSRTDATRETWLTLADAFADLLRAADGAPKLPLLRQWLVDLADDGRRGLIVTRNRSAAQALTDVLQEDTGTPYGWQAKVRVVGMRDLVGAEKYVRAGHRHRCAAGSRPA
jgi:hypothetical protein